MSERDRIAVYGGVDTHRDSHVAAVVDHAGRLLGSAEFGADSPGYGQLERWLRSWGKWFGSGWRAPAATAPASPVI